MTTPNNPMGWTLKSALVALETSVHGSGDVVIGAQLPSIRVIAGLLRQSIEERLLLQTAYQMLNAQVVLPEDYENWERRYSDHFTRISAQLEVAHG